MTADLYQENAENAASILLLNNVNDQIIEQISATHFSDDLQIEVLALLFEQQLSQHSQQLKFLGRTGEFCHLASDAGDSV
ncbi:Exodeoxyribonuclease V, gamma subunit [Mannheimia haemolytica]|uniref:Exodeoxyribonuclease V, gamma subunit n=1 Tax=Mannheimia haemolytica TaxID=75985 RepID=A0A378MWI5_MANHA|nr:Exodeoxyribonuclease V, gamma subunit [Mannheimia haemolytica]